MYTLEAHTALTNLFLRFQRAFRFGIRCYLRTNLNAFVLEYDACKLGKHHSYTFPCYVKILNIVHFMLATHTLGAFHE
ncbi:hypothetical protein AQUCO_06700003v1 [Aquilegia coerulea]|uniref:Uncharacterized protein n=1 Tax=Aquilegia coerulea TaxID=218851 RepID=A0A2G5CBM4_AQUCA|nr:hypothetical protein AQUCO_06700003v1 [Aquilegia coerulea]